jgi:hypothetical protein
MAIDLDVIPGSPRSIRWVEIKRLLDFLVPPGPIRRQIGTEPALYELPSKRLVTDDEVLTSSRCYYFDMAHCHSLSMYIARNRDDREDFGYISDFGRNLSPQVLESLYRRWKQAGFLVCLSSRAIRDQNDLTIMAFIAITIAQLTEGCVVVMDNGIFPVSVGVYSPEEFLQALS